ncbi:MAG: tRNA (5-methylaminomethyl-2-thiouridine)(34)-methyltransferase MnmD [Bacteroidota bacterium]
METSKFFEKTDPIEHRLTKDGSSTLFSHQFNQHYHNPNGALSESLHVFFEYQGLIEALQSSETIRILEIGFGTGLNLAILADLLTQLETPPEVQFYSIEAFPISAEVASSLSFSDLSNQTLVSDLVSIFGSVHSGWNISHPFQDVPITLHLFVGAFEKAVLPQQFFDFIFHDPFSPEVNGELWTPEVFKTLKQSSKPGARLATYCAASKARSAIAAAGWYVARAPGALGKREMTLASLSEDRLAGFKRVNERRLIERLEQGEFDG